ncbi:MAG: hypothetical protein ACRCS9_08275 [Hyphomicrobium sp.]
MTMLYEFSAAPHLPFALRHEGALQDGGNIVVAFLSALETSSDILVAEHNGELHVALA